MASSPPGSVSPMAGKRDTDCTKSTFKLPNTRTRFIAHPQHSGIQPCRNDRSSAPSRVTFHAGRCGMLEGNTRSSLAARNDCLRAKLPHVYVHRCIHRSIAKHFLPSPSRRMDSLPEDEHLHHQVESTCVQYRGWGLPKRSTHFPKDTGDRRCPARRTAIPTRAVSACPPTLHRRAHLLATPK